MNIKTESIIDIVESVLNKKIDNIDQKELDIIKSLRISKTDYDGILKVDSNDLNFFNNLEELSIEGCMIDETFINNLINTNTIKKLQFIECDFVDNIEEYFNNLKVKELLFFNCLGLNNLTLSNIESLSIAELPNNIKINNIKNLDLRHCTSIDYDLIINFNIKNLIISKEQINEQIKEIPYTVTIKDEYDEVIKVINNA
ncbi:MAG: hypothetical protein VZS44_02245 [Bacilli bacterium]|nr:hypothetical protein [Bacilli bacterium]